MSKLPKTITMHGVFVEVFDLGILLSGKGGIGKSELALGLIDRGHKLIADDSVLFHRTETQVIGQAPKILKDFIEVRGLGILNVRKMYGEISIRHKKSLSLIINILNVGPKELYQIDRLNGMHAKKELLGLSFPEVSIPVAPGRNLAILVEAAVKNQFLRQKGYNASKAFTKRHQYYMQKEKNDD